MPFDPYNQSKYFMDYGVPQTQLEYDPTDPIQGEHGGDPQYADPSLDEPKGAQVQGFLSRLFAMTGDGDMATAFGLMERGTQNKIRRGMGDTYSQVMRTGEVPKEVQDQQGLFQSLLADAFA